MALPGGPSEHDIADNVNGPEAVNEHENGAVNGPSEACFVSPWTSIPVDDRMNYLTNYLYYLACITLGDKEEYTSFLKLQSRENEVNKNAHELLQSDLYFQQLHDFINLKIKEIAENGSRGLPDVCAVIAQQSRLPCTHCFFWVTCAVSGTTINHSLKICQEQPIYVSMKFAPFVWSYWLVWHIQNIELERVNKYMRSVTEDVSITDNIEGFVSSEYYASDNDKQIYEQAISVVMNTLQVSLS